MYNSLHGANITGANLDNDGNLMLKFEDLYNFSKNSKSGRSMAGYKLQQQGLMQPYYIRTTVKIPKSELDKY